MNDLPAFLMKRFVVSHISEMIQWSIKEYNQAVRDLSRRGSYKAVKFLNEEYSPMRVLAETSEFKTILKLLDDVNYNKLGYRERVFVRRAYELYESLR